MMNDLAKRGARRLCFIQLVATLIMALIFAIRWHWIAVYSALLGGVVCILPTMYFAHKLFQHRGARQARNIVKSFYVGEAVKIIFSILLFSLVFLYVTIEPLAFFSTFIVVQCMHWFAPWLFVK